MSLELLQIQLETLYQLDAHGRIRCVNEPDPPAAPRLFVGRSAHGLIWRVRFDIAESLAQNIAAVCSNEPPAADLEAPPRCQAALHTLLAPVVNEWRGPAFMIPEAARDIGDALWINSHNSAVLERHFGDSRAMAGHVPMTAWVIEGVAVALCFSSRVGSRADEAGVATHAGYRGRGYAIAVVAAWAELVRSLGRIPLYSTSWENQASRSVARKLGARLYGEDWSIS